MGRKPPAIPPVKCSAKSKQTGEQCKQWATQGSNVCRFHGSRTPQAKAAAARRLALAEAEVQLQAEALTLGRVVDVDTADAMLATVQEAAWNVAVYRRLVQQLGLGVGPGMIAEPTGSTTKFNEVDANILLRMYDAERGRLMAWSKQCRDAGVDERMVAIAEREVDIVEQVLAVMARASLAAILGYCVDELGVTAAEATQVRRYWDGASADVIDAALSSAIEATSTHP